MTESATAESATSQMRPSHGAQVETEPHNAQEECMGRLASTPERGPVSCLLSMAFLVVALSEEGGE